QPTVVATSWLLPSFVLWFTPIACPRERPKPLRPFPGPKPVTGNSLRQCNTEPVQPGITELAPCLDQLFLPTRWFKSLARRPLRPAPRRWWPPPQPPAAAPPPSPPAG